MSRSTRLCKSLFLAGASLLLGFPLSAGPVRAQEPQDNNQYQQTQPDNTKTNKRDRDKSSPTADQQKMNATDRDLTRKIRSALHQDKSLSTYAHNIKIIARDGHVTLKGPVRSEEEKSAIVSKASEIAGPGNVTDQLEVAPPKS